MVLVFIDLLMDVLIHLFICLFINLSIYLLSSIFDNFSSSFFIGMASSKGTTAELDSLVCIRIDRPSRMNAFKPKGSFCKVLAVIEVSKDEGE